MLPSIILNSISPVLSMSLTFSESVMLRSKKEEWICLMTSWPESPKSIMTLPSISLACMKFPDRAVSSICLMISGLAIPVVW